MTKLKVGKLYRIKRDGWKHSGRPELGIVDGNVKLPLNVTTPLSYFRSPSLHKEKGYRPDPWDWLEPGEVVMWLGQVKVTEHFKFYTALWRGKVGFFGRGWNLETDLAPRLMEINLPLLHPSGDKKEEEPGDQEV